MIAKEIIKFHEIDSTNNYALQLLQNPKEVTDGTVILADYQTNGRGLQENKWNSQAKKNLLFSIILFPKNVEAHRQFFLSQFASVSIVNYLRKKNIKAVIKWPNDILVEDKKIAGILIENTIQGIFLKNAVIGIGMNINQNVFGEEKILPISLKNILNKEFDTEEELSLLSKEFNLLYRRLTTKLNNLNYFNDIYIKNLYRYNIWSEFKANGIVFEGKIVGISELGQLIVENRANKMTNYNFKEIEFVFQFSTFKK